jgi:hypothetical protein
MKKFLKGIERPSGTSIEVDLESISGSSGSSESGFSFIEREISLAEWDTLHTTPVELVPAVPNKTIFPCLFSCVYDSVALQVGGPLLRLFTGPTIDNWPGITLGFWQEGLVYALFADGGEFGPSGDDSEIGQPLTLMFNSAAPAGSLGSRGAKVSVSYLIV